jgi:cellulose synthase (UDP-forming)
MIRPLSEFASRIRLWKANGSGILSIAVNGLFLGLLWLILPLERQPLSRIRDSFECWYPQIDPVRPRFFDPVRFLIQTAFIAFFRVQRPKDGGTVGRAASAAAGALLRGRDAAGKAAGSLASRLARFGRLPGRAHPARRAGAVWALALAAFAMSVLTITQPMDLPYQLVYVAAMWIAALAASRIKSHIGVLLMICISVLISSRYIWWRVTATLLFRDLPSSVCALLLIGAEIYSFVIMLLSYFQASWVLDRKPEPLPDDVSKWPTVDVFIPTYNEPLEVVKPCLLAATDLDWPRGKLKFYLLDDGSREEFREYAESCGARYIARTKHDHAKAGNINNALKVTDGDIVAIFDCDHIPSRSFLQMTAGWMVRDPKIALVQTPHHFYSEDPFEKNLGIKGRVPEENALFHDFIQAGNDTWNATMFCGSCALIRRSALMQVGGIAEQTVTEDAHTSLKLCRAGWSSAFIGMPLAAGLSTESLADHINQRIRWARGMVQIFRIDNPMLGRGLTMGQRICFLNAMLHFFHGLPRIIFLLAPLPFIFFNTYVIFASAAALLAYVIPYMAISAMSSHRIHGHKRFFFWGVVYETVLSWYITVPTLVALIAPSKGKFNVTAKGDSNAKTYFDWTVSRPYVLLIALNAAGAFWAVWRLIFDQWTDSFTLLINLVWVLYNLLVLGAAAAVALERRQVRRTPRVKAAIPVSIELPDGSTVAAATSDFSFGGLGVISKEGGPGWEELLPAGRQVRAVFDRSGSVFSFPCDVRRARGRFLGLEPRFDGPSAERDYVRCTFAAADRWIHDEDSLVQDNAFRGAHMLVALGLNGYRKMLQSGPVIPRSMLRALLWILSFAFSFIPSPVDAAGAAPSEGRS